MSNRNNPDPNEHNRQLLAKRNEGVMENFIVHVLNARDLRGE